MNSDSYLAKGLNVSSRILLGVAYIYIEDRLEFLTLNETGSFIWGQINGTQTVNGIIQKATEAFDAPPDMVSEATLAFLSSLEQQGIIAVSDVAFEGVMADA